MPTLYEMSKCGRAVVASLAATGYNSNVTYNGAAVSDLDVNVIYGVVKLVGGAAGQTLVLPSVQSNWCYICNQSTQSVAVKSSQSDPTPETVDALENAVVFFDGSRYRKLTASTNPIDISAFSSVGTPVGTDLLWSRTALGDQKLTLAQLTSYIGANITVPSQVVLQPVKLVYTGYFETNGLSTPNQDGQTPSAGDRVLIQRDTDSYEAGVWIASAGAWSRAPDMPGGLSVSGVIVPVERTPTVVDFNPDPVSPASFAGSVWMSRSGIVGDTMDGFDQISIDLNRSKDLESDASLLSGGGYANSARVKQLSGDKTTEIVTVSAEKMVWNRVTAIPTNIPAASTAELCVVDAGSGDVLAQTVRYSTNRQARIQSIGYGETVSCSSPAGVTPTINLFKLDSHWNDASGHVDIVFKASTGGSQRVMCVFSATISGNKNAYLSASSDPAMNKSGNNGSVVYNGGFINTNTVLISVDTNNIVYLTVPFVYPSGATHNISIIVSGQVVLTHTTATFPA